MNALSVLILFASVFTCIAGYVDTSAGATAHMYIENDLLITVSAEGRVLIHLNHVYAKNTKIYLCKNGQRRGGAVVMKCESVETNRAFDFSKLVVKIPVDTCKDGTYFILVNTSFVLWYRSMLIAYDHGRGCWAIHRGGRLFSLFFFMATSVIVAAILTTLMTFKWRYGMRGLGVLL